MISIIDIILSVYLFHFLGKASVIIALTDGELNEQPLIAAQQEVKTLAGIYTCAF